MERRQFLVYTSALSGGILLPGQKVYGQGAGPKDNPAANYKLPWVDSLPWANVIDVTKQPGNNIAEQLEAAQTVLVSQAGGVAYFPAGTYKFSKSIKLKDGVILRGAAPAIASAKADTYALLTRLEFPKYTPSFEGEGTPIYNFFHGIYNDRAITKNIGVVHIHVERGHIHFQENPETHEAGENRLVFGCVLRNCAVADQGIPNVNLGQKAWQRFTARHHAAIDIYAQMNILCANNRLPKSGEDNFTQPGYMLQQNVRGKDNKIEKVMTPVDIVFDYDNRPGLYINHYSVGGPGGNGPDGTPETYPFAFRKGIVIRDNFIYNSGRMGIGFAGDGVICRDNIIRLEENVYRPTVQGTAVTAGSATNDNRAIEMRGWRWQVIGNDYIVHSNIAFDKKYKINDGEGLMHEDHANSTVKDSVLSENRGNTYLSIYKTAGIDGLIIHKNDIRIGDGKTTNPKGAAIMADANRNKGQFECKNVQITENTVAGAGIVIAGTPAANNVVKGNKCLSQPPASIKNDAKADLSGNQGFQ